MTNNFKFVCFNLIRQMYCFSVIWQNYLTNISKQTPLS
jgi:hypothetical protein